jgi:hypothetical protein
MLRIHFDFNNFVDGDTFELDSYGSMRDIELHGQALKDGLRVLLYMTDHLEVEATIRFDRQRSIWLGVADWSTKRLLSEPPGKGHVNSSG